MTQERLRQLLNYDTEIGLFHWRIDRTGGTKAGDQAGYKCGTGHIKIKVDGQLYGAQVLAWIYVYGVEPDRDVDHKNTIPYDNRFINLRLATNSGQRQNIQKAHKRSLTKLLGVSVHGKRFRAKLVVDGKILHRSYHETPEQAHAAYLEAKETFHPYQTIIDNRIMFTHVYEDSEETIELGN